MKFDIIIIGGGMVGAALACALSREKWQIALIDATSMNASNDTRLIALNAGSCRLLENIGIWPNLATHAAPIEQIHVSHRGHFGITRITADELEIDALGHVVPAHYINTALHTALRNIKNVKLICPATLQTLKQDTNTVTISISTATGTEEHTATILIGADGSHSTVRQLLGITTKEINYQQSALVTVTELARDHKNIAYERFQDQGAIAMLPLPGERVATIWTAASDTITQLLQFNDVEFLQQLQKQFGYRLGRLLQVGKRAVYPLHMQLAQEQKKQNVVLIGNAAHTLHPIASQGLNLALYEIAVLLDYLSAQTSLDHGLQHLTLESRQQNFSQSLSHGLTELFSKDFFLLNAARQLGMVGFDTCSLAKKYFAQSAMGQAGHVPQLFIPE